MQEGEGKENFCNISWSISWVCVIWSTDQVCRWAGFFFFFFFVKDQTDVLQQKLREQWFLTCRFVVKRERKIKHLLKLVGQTRHSHEMPSEKQKCACTSTEMSKILHKLETSKIRNASNTLQWTGIELKPNLNDTYLLHCDRKRKSKPLMTARVEGSKLHFLLLKTSFSAAFSVFFFFLFLCISFNCFVRKEELLLLSTNSVPQEGILNHTLSRRAKIPEWPDCKSKHSSTHIHTHISFISDFFSTQQAHVRKKRKAKQGRLSVSRRHTSWSWVVTWSMPDF